MVDVIGDWTYRRDFPDCLIRSGTSTDMNCYRGVRQLNALHHLTLQPNFTAQFCKTNYDRTVKIAPSCDEVQFLPVQWSPTDFEGVSIEPNYVPWTEVTILGVVSTTMVSGKTESSGDVPTSLPTETLAVKGNDIEILLLRILTGCFITASVVFLVMWFGLKCRKKDQEFMLIAHYINSEEEKENLKNNPSYSGSNDYRSGLFLNPSYATSPTAGGESSTHDIVSHEEYPVNLNSPIQPFGSRIEEIQRTDAETNLESSISPAPVSFRSSRLAEHHVGPKKKHRVSFYVNPTNVRATEDFGYVEMKSLSDCATGGNDGQTDKNLETSFVAHDMELVSRGTAKKEVISTVIEVNENEYEQMDLDYFTDVSSLDS